MASIVVCTEPGSWEQAGRFAEKALADAELRTFQDLRRRIPAQPILVYLTQPEYDHVRSLLQVLKPGSPDVVIYYASRPAPEQAAQLGKLVGETRPEHTTVVFEAKAAIHQRKFADEVRRIGKGYFVLTPYKFFPIESHTIAPGFVVLLPRSVQLEIWKRWPFYNHVPDFNLLTVCDMKQYFPDAEIHLESEFGLTKSIMAVKRG